MENIGSEQISWLLAGVIIALCFTELARLIKTMVIGTPLPDPQKSVGAQRTAMRKESTTSSRSLTSGTGAFRLPPGLLGYFVSYNYVSDGGATGFGCIEVGRSQTVRSFDDVQAMTEVIEDALKVRYDGSHVSVVILDWQPFEAPTKDGSKEPVPEEGPKNVVLRLVA